MLKTKIPLLICMFLSVMVGSYLMRERHAWAQSTDVDVPNMPNASIAEAGDFATLVLGDPWDMSEYSDVSQYINESGERDVVRNISVTGGIFSATSAGNDTEGRNGWFFTLFPGYLTTIHSGKTGSRTPIDSGDYRCLFIAMNVQSSAPDWFRAFWFADDRLNIGGAPFGVTNGLPIYPESSPVQAWKLYKLDLVAESISSPGFTAWNGRSTWQGLRIDPTVRGNVDYEVDWVRLTSCSPRNVTITFTPNGNVKAIWLRPQGTTRRIRVATNVSGGTGSYSLDVQGVAPGSYFVGFGTEATCCFSESAQLLTINQTPIVRFQAPTPYSGVDYATVSGNPWDMSSSQDYLSVQCATHGLGSGYLWVNTPPSSAQPPSCRGTTPPFSADPKVLLNTPVPVNTADYRYLTFRMYDNNTWQFVARGSIVRWVWAAPGGSGNPGQRCYMVSQDIPFDVGWNTYTIDLWDTFAGSAEGWAGDCNSVPKNWRQNPSVLETRFDPNENITNHNFYNEIDWIRLTKPITVVRGQPYRLGLNKYFPGDSFNVSLFYTTDPANNPTQHAMVLFTPSIPPPAGPNWTYLPTVVVGVPPSSTSADLDYLWNTGPVSPGAYYVCARVSDSLNQAIFCSEVTVTVTN